MKSRLVLFSLLVTTLSAISQAQYYTGVSGAAFKSDDFTSLGAGVRFGYSCPLDCCFLKHGLELELWGIHGTASQRSGSVTGTFGGSSLTTFSQRKVTLNQIPVFINYRVDGVLCGADAFSWYAGAGVGVEWFHARSSQRLIAESAPSIVFDEVSQSTHKSRARFVGQLFAGLGYQLTEAVTFNLGARMMLQERNVWNDIPYKKFPTTVKTSACQVGVEAGINIAL